MVVHQSQPKSLRVGFLLDDSLDRPDGVQQWVLAAGAYLTRAGHQVTYFAGQTARGDLDRLVSLGRLKNWCFNRNRGQSPSWISRAELRDAWTENPVDIVHLQAPYSPLLAHRFCRQLPPSVPIVASFHVLPANWLAGVGLRALGWAVASSKRRIGLFTGNSEATCQFYRRAWGVDSQLVYNPVEVGRFRAASPRVWPKSDGGINIVFLGRLVPRKGADILIEAADKLPSDLKRRVRLQIGGRGPLRQSLENQVRAAGLASQTKFWGFIDEADKPAFLAGAEVVVLPSTAGESFGISLVEALATGRSLVLAGDNPGYRSILADKPELLFDPNHPNQLADKLTDYLGRSRAGRQPLIDWGSQQVENYNVDTAIGPQLEAIYRRQLSAKSVAGLVQW